MDVPIVTSFYSQPASFLTVGFSTVAAFVILIVLNALFQLAFQNPNEPPVVFHWFPFIGNTVSYGIDPYKFFFSCREKVGSYPLRLSILIPIRITYKRD